MTNEEIVTMLKNEHVCVKLLDGTTYYGRLFVVSAGKVYGVFPDSPYERQHNFPESQIESITVSQEEILVLRKQIEDYKHLLEFINSYLGDINFTRMITKYQNALKDKSYGH